MSMVQDTWGTCDTDVAQPHNVAVQLSSQTEDLLRDLSFSHLEGWRFGRIALGLSPRIMPLVAKILLFQLFTTPLFTTYIYPIWWAGAGIIFMGHVFQDPVSTHYFGHRVLQICNVHLDKLQSGTNMFERRAVMRGGFFSL